MQPSSARAWYVHVDQVLGPLISDPQERKAIVRRLLSHYLGYDITQHVLDHPLEADERTVSQIAEAIDRLRGNEPIQYILGSAPFMSYDLSVNTSVLIPRPETEEMVSSILSEQDLEGKRVLDIGTGSGCIAIALKKECPQAVVEALDCFPSALDVARENALRLGANIHWYLLDFLHRELPNTTWDLMVSNPPYIPIAEISTISEQVLLFEPPIALFVPDDNPYLFYHRIASVAKRHLNPEGKVYVECHATAARQVKDIFLAHEFRTVDIYHDLAGKERWLRADR